MKKLHNLLVPMLVVGFLSFSANIAFGQWTAIEREEFKKGCLSETSGAFGEKKAIAYCECSLQALEKKYPKTSALETVSEEQLQKDVYNCIEKVYANGWEKEDKEIFVQTCVTEAEETLGKEEATKYCQCSMEKLVKKYANPLKVDEAPDEEVEKIVTECLKK